MDAVSFLAYDNYEVITRTNAGIRLKKIGIALLHLSYERHILQIEAYILPPEIVAIITGSERILKEVTRQSESCCINAKYGSSHWLV